MLRLDSLLLLLSCPLLQSVALSCPSPFTIQAGLCVFVSTAQRHRWCSANQQCASIGGELLNSYESVKLLVEQRIPAASCSCDLWVGLSDLADERNVSRAGWQRVNGNGVFPEDGDLFNPGDPGGKNQNCLRSVSGGLLRDSFCDRLYGFICEFAGGAHGPPTVSIWMVAAFKRIKFNSDYCFTDVPAVDSAVKCVAAAMRAGRSSRHVLYNSKLRTCRLLLFTDAQVEAEIETSADWVKFRLQ